MVEVVIDVRDSVRALRRELGVLQERQIPFIERLAVNDIARGVVADLKTEMTSVFDRPTPWTLNAFFAKPATGRSDPTASVQDREFAAKGTPAWKYLEPEIEGGPRRMKRFERRFSQLSGGQYIVPGPGAQFDGYGNLSTGQIGRILSALGAAGDQSATAKSRARKLARGAVKVGEFFVAYKAGRATGVFQRYGKSRPVAVLLFTPSPPTYRPRLQFDRVARQSVAKRAPAAFAAAAKRALATAWEAHPATSGVANLSPR